MPSKKIKSNQNTRDLIIGIFSIVISSFFLFTQTGKNLFVPFENCQNCLELYYYIISYGLVIAGIFFVLRALNVVKSE